MVYSLYMVRWRLRLARELFGRLVEDLRRTASFVRGTGVWTRVFDKEKKNID